MGKPVKRISQLQVEQYERERQHIDDQPHMTLTPAKDGQLWRGGDHLLHPSQRTSLLSASEAFFQGFHAGARWGYRVGRSRARRRR